MTEKIEAIYRGGVFTPTRQLDLRDEQRVRLTVETIDEPERDRAAAVARLKAGIASMDFASREPLPKRDDLHRCR
jgi:predicted DNA-binding antitoxin AbrB/MazE fold protein